MRVAIASLLVLAACGKSGPPSCHDRVAAMAAHLAAPRSLADLGAKPAPPQELAQKLVPAVGPCKAATDVFAGVAGVDGDKRAYLRDKLPPAIESCQCSADPDTVGPLVEQLFDAWSAPPAP